jgi:hypothetical protein
MDFGGPWQVALVNDRDRVQPCDREVVAGAGDRGHSAHVISRTRRDHVRHALRLSASGGPSSVHQQSLLLDGDRAVVAVGAWLCAVDLPLLGVEWSVEVDWACCFGVHRAGDDYLSHGELSIRRVGRDGKIRWQASGRDIFTGRLEVQDDVAVVEDFDHHRYRIDLATGRIEELR